MRTQDTATTIPEIRPGQSIELLKELHILTRDGKLNQDTRRKLKQVYHLYQFIEPLLAEAQTLADHGAGKSYLGFILYDLYFKGRESGHIYGIETRKELVEKSRALATRLGFGRMSFLDVTVEDSIGDSNSSPATDSHFAPSRSTSQPTSGFATASAMVTSSTAKPNCTRVRPNSWVRPPTNRPLV